MWILIVVFVQAGSAFTVPGYSSQESCSAAGKQILLGLMQAPQPGSPSGVRITFLCEHPD